MKILIATSVRVAKVNNRMYLTAPFAVILKRYFSAFGEITLCTRVVEKEQVEEKLVDVTEMVKKIIPLSRLTDIYKSYNKGQLEAEIRESDLVIARVPSIVSYRAADIAKKLGKSCYTEIMGCAWDAYWNHGLKGKLVAPYMFLKMKSVVKKAAYALYVTEEFLQRRYPTKGQALGLSNVKIPAVSDEVINKRLEKIRQADKKNIVLMTSAAVDVKYKGQEYAIRAMKELKDAGISVKYYLAGGGNKEYLYNIAKENNVENDVIFLGNLSHEEVFARLDEADIYIQPSLQEGLPRAVIEALSRGCICLGARTGGIPELLQEKFVLKRRSVVDIVKAIKELSENDDWEKIVRENFARAMDFEENKLDEKRNAFYCSIRDEIKK